MAHRRRGHLSKRRRIMLGITLALLDKRDKELHEEAQILKKNKKLFLKEYRKICRKYRCHVSSLSGEFISAERKGEKIYTITSHLSSLRRKSS